MPADRPNFDDQLVTFFEQSDFPFGGEWQCHSHLVDSVLFAKAEWLLSAGDRRGIFSRSIQHGGQLFQPLSPENFMRKQRHALNRDGSEIFFDFTQYFVL